MIEKTVVILLSQTISTFDDAFVNTMNIVRDNVAELRASTINNRSGSTTNTPHQCGELGGNDIAPIIDNADAPIANDEAPLTLRYCYVTNSDKTANGSRSDSTHEYLVGAAHTIHMDVEAEQMLYNERQNKSRRLVSPMDEFT